MRGNPDTYFAGVSGEIGWQMCCSSEDKGEGARPKACRQMKRLIGDGFSPAIKFRWIRNENAEGFLSRPFLQLIQLVNGLVVSGQSGQTIEGFRRKSYHPAVDNELGGLPYGFLASGRIMLHFEYEWHTNDYKAKIPRTNQKINPKSEYRNPKQFSNFQNSNDLNTVFRNTSGYQAIGDI
jgi:hypothetical protein